MPLVWADFEYFSFIISMILNQIIIWNKSIHISGCHERDSVGQSWKAPRD